MTHQHISFFKSGIRILGYFFLAYAACHVDNQFVLGVGFSCVLAGEILGIVEEIVNR